MLISLLLRKSRAPAMLLKAFQFSFVIGATTVSLGQDVKFTSGYFPPLRKEYADIARLSKQPDPLRKVLDTISFPIEEMDKALYRALKLRAVYIDVPLDSFKIADFPANSSKQTKAELDYLLKLQEARTPGMIESAEQIATVSF